jgi:protein phosphatase 2C family protein 2/3
VLLMEMALVLLQSMASICLLSHVATALTALAEFRGPGVHHNFDDSDSGYDVDVETRPKDTGGNDQRGGRIILLGDGTEVLTDSDDTAEMFDRGEEDKDLESQVSRGHVVGQELNAPNAGALPEKLDVTDPTYKAVAEKVHANPAEPVVNVVSEATPEAKDE